MEVLCALLIGAGHAHHEQRDDDGDVADAIDEEAPALVFYGDEKSGEGGSDQSGHVDHRGVDGDGVGEVGAVLDHLDHEGLTAGHVEGVDDALESAEGKNFADGDAIGEGEPREGERLKHGEGLGPRREPCGDRCGRR